MFLVTVDASLADDDFILTLSSSSGAPTPHQTFVFISAYILGDKSEDPNKFYQEQKKLPSSHITALTCPESISLLILH